MTRKAVSGDCGALLAPQAGQALESQLRLFVKVHLKFTDEECESFIRANQGRIEGAAPFPPDAFRKLCELMELPHNSALIERALKRRHGVRQQIDPALTGLN